MNMNMYIVMYMNIYIQPEIETLLRAYDGSMSGLINRLLADYFTSSGVPLKTASGIKVVTKKIADLPDGKITLSSTPVGPNPFHKMTTDKVSSNIRPDIKSVDDDFVEAGKRVGGLPCCLKAKPCQHWQWDTDNAQWVNILSGEKRDA